MAKALSFEQAAKLLGMKEREISATETSPDGDVITTTHDGAKTTVAADGSMSFEIPGRKA